MDTQLTSNPSDRTLGPLRIPTGLQRQPSRTLTQLIGTLPRTRHDSDPFQSSLPLSNPERFTSGEPIDSAAWLTQRAATQLPAATSRPPDACTPTGTPNPPSGFDGDPDRLIDDPTSSGQITARLLHLYQQTLTAFPDTKWACYSPRPGTKSEHPLGRACDLTFGDQIGHYPNPEQVETGWQVTNWMKDNADLLGVQYLIWQGKIWSVAREAEGWRPYNGGGMHNPNDVTGGHYDHLHVTVKAGA